MNGRFQMQGGKNWILPKEINANQFFWDSHWLEIWPNHLFPSMGPNGGSWLWTQEVSRIRGRGTGGKENGRSESQEISRSGDHDVSRTRSQGTGGPEDRRTGEVWRSGDP
jgi:hypothetical protein